VKTKGLVIGFVVLLIAAALFVFVGKANRQNGTLFYSGTIEATQVRLSFQVSGRVLKVHVEEGQRVENGRLLVEMEPDEFDARVSQAQANLDRARKVELQAKAALAVLEKTLPAEVARAEAGLRSARAVLRDAERNDQRYANLFDQDVVSEKDRDTVRLNYEMAKSRLAESESLLGLARGNLSRLEASRKDVDAARAQIAVAEAALTQARIQRTYAELRSPLAGVVTSRGVEPGEIVSAGREILSVSDLSRVDLNIYVDETSIGRVRPGQRALVRVDTFPDRDFEAKVSFVSPEGEFTPKIIQTQKERVKLVYLVKVSIPNPRFELKTGMPADALLVE